MQIQTVRPLIILIRTGITSFSFMVKYNSCRRSSGSPQQSSLAYTWPGARRTRAAAAWSQHCGVLRPVLPCDTMDTDPRPDHTARIGFDWQHQRYGAALHYRRHRIESNVAFLLLPNQNCTGAGRKKEKNRSRFYGPQAYIFRRRTIHKETGPRLGAGSSCIQHTSLIAVLQVSRWDSVGFVGTRWVSTGQRGTLRVNVGQQWSF